MGIEDEIYYDNNMLCLITIRDGTLCLPAQADAFPASFEDGPTQPSFALEGASLVDVDMVY